jgi:hypothetical protein
MVGDRWTRADVAKFLGVSKCAVVKHEEDGRFAPSRFAPIAYIETTFGFPVPVYDPRDVKLYAKQRAQTIERDQEFIRQGVFSVLSRWGRRTAWEAAEAAALRVPERAAVYRRVRIDVSGRPRDEEIRELLLAGAEQVLYRHGQAGTLADLTYTALCAEAALAVWQDQVKRDEFYWLPAGWAASSDPLSYAASFRTNAASRVRKLVGDDLKKLLQNTGTKLVA